MKRIYLDANATTPMAPEAVEAYVDANKEGFANPSSLHQDGQRAQRLLEEAQETVAHHLDCDPEEVIFTSGGTEGNNTVFYHFLYHKEPGRIVLSAMEHPSVHQWGKIFQDHGWEVIWIAPDRQGRVPAEAFEPFLEPPTHLVSLMLANNETGVLQPVEEVAHLCREKGIPMHTDAVQAVGKIPVSFRRLGVDYLTSSGHKLYGPKGVGVLLRKKGTPLSPLIIGGGQQGNMRSGTPPTPLIVAYAKALAVAVRDLPLKDVEALRDFLEDQLATIPHVAIHGKNHPRLPNTCHIGVRGVEGEALQIHLDLKGFSVATGSACTSGKQDISHVLQAMGIPLEEARGSLRISLLKTTTKEEIQAFIQALQESIHTVRQTGVASWNN